MSWALATASFQDALEIIAHDIDALEERRWVQDSVLVWSRLVPAGTATASFQDALEIVALNIDAQEGRRCMAQDNVLGQET